MNRSNATDCECCCLLLADNCYGGLITNKQTTTTTTTKVIMISNFFVLSPRGDTIIAKQYRNDRGDAGAHERSHTEAFFRKIKFWDDRHHTPGSGGVISEFETDTMNGKLDESTATTKTGDAPPVFLMPDGLTYMHVKRNGLIFGCSTARNVSAVTVIEVRS
jgi:AP-4 complex subunit mu-1